MQNDFFQSLNLFDWLGVFHESHFIIVDENGTKEKVVFHLIEFILQSISLCE